jgi:hypothetical protein
MATTTEDTEAGATGDRPSSWSNPWPWAAVGYVAIAVAITWPLAGRLASVMPHDAGDPVLVSWLLWWNAHHLPFSVAWWNPPAFFPTAGVLAFSEHFLGFAPLTSPLQWLGASPITAYNVAFLLSFPACGIAMHALVRRLTGRHDAAWLAGLVFAFGPTRAAHLAHLHVLWSFGMPLALLGLHQFLDGRRAGLLLFGVAWLFQGLSNGYFLVYFSVLVLFWALWFASGSQRWRLAAGVAGTWALAVLPVLPILIGYRTRLESFGFRRSITEIESLSGDVLSVLSGTPDLVFWRGRLLEIGAERDFFPGLTAALLVCVIAIISWRRRSPSPGSPRWRITLLAASLLFGLTALSVPLVGGWDIHLGPVSLSVGRIHKPLSLAVLALTVYGLTGSRIVALMRTRSVLAFYTMAGILMWVLSLGPTPKLDGAPLLYKAPYAWMMLVPAIGNLRVPARLITVATVCLAVAIGVGFSRAVGWTGGWRRALVAACTIGILVDGWFGPMTIVSAPVPWTLNVTATAADAVLELPTGGSEQEVAAVFRMTYHNRPTVTGYSGYSPGHYLMISRAAEAGDPAVLDTLPRLGRIQIMVDRRSDQSPRWMTLLRADSHATLLGEDANWSAWLLDGRPPDAVAGATGTEVIPIRVTAPPGTGDIPGLHDRRLETGWLHSATARGGEQLVADLGSVQAIDSVVMTLGPYAGSLPRALRVEGAADAGQWRQLWEGSVLDRAVAAALAHPREVPVRIPVSARARMIRLTAIGLDLRYGWGAVDLSVITAAASPPAGAGGK